MTLAIPQAATSRPTLPPELVRVLPRLGAVLILGVALSLLSGAFLSVVNLVNVLRQASLLFFMSSGLTLVVITAGLDLSVGAEIAIRYLRREAVSKKVTQPSVVVTTANLAAYDVPVEQRQRPAWDKVPQN